MDFMIFAAAVRRSRFVSAMVDENGPGRRRRFLVKFRAFYGLSPTHRYPVWR